MQNWYKSFTHGKHRVEGVDREMAESLAETVWFSKSQSSLLNVTFRLR